MPIAGAMSHIIPNHILRVGQSTRLDSAHEAALGCSPSAMMDPNGGCSEQDDLDISLDNLNQLILELDPTFEPIHINKRSQSSSLHTVDFSSPDEDVSRCVLFPRGCSPRNISTSFSSISPSCSIPIPLSPASGSRCSPQSSLVFSDASSRPPLPCGSVLRRQQPSMQGGEVGMCSSPVTLRMSHSHRNSAVSMLSTSPGSETSYMMGSYQSLLSDSEGDSPESLLLYRTSSSFSDVSRSSTRPFTNRQSPDKPSPTGPSPLGHFQGIHSSPHSSPASLAGSLTDIPVVLVNGAPERELSPQSPPEAMVPDIQIKQRPSSRPSSPSPSNSFQGHFQGNQHSMKFVMDTSQFWFRPHINRVQAEAIVIDKEPGTFVVRDSTSFRGSFGLAMKVDQVNISPTGQPAEGSSELVKHFLIESSAKGVRIKGSSQEPYFGSLSALVFQHTITAYALPCKLLLQSHELNKGEEGTNDRSAPEDKAKTACNFLYLSAIPTEMLTGPCAVQKAVSSTFTMDLSTKTPTIVNLKVSPKGVTLTDIQRKLFFRRHYPAHLLSYSGEDPDKRLWHKSSKPARIFGIVAKGTEAGMENVCHVFAEYDSLQPCNPTIELTQGIIFKP
ncbi:tensin-4 [Coregonus clupeaformis]|uniref:tensin-4 n=1 Tax=Coregonus clupeaformis TaxID=59861 RepID=UPI001BE039D9|nr:tensin-4 [Coregonus clupeaformis]